MAGGNGWSNGVDFINEQFEKNCVFRRTIQLIGLIFIVLGLTALLWLGRDQ